MPIVERGEGVYLYDEEGTRYFDASSGPITCNIGHANPKVLEAIRNQSPEKKIILASSANVYGNCIADSIDENIQPQPLNHYAMSKLSMEYISYTYMQDLNIVITRPFNYTGFGQSKDFIIPKLVHHFKNRQSNTNIYNNTI